MMEKPKTYLYSTSASCPDPQLPSSMVFLTFFLLTLRTQVSALTSSLSEPALAQIVRVVVTAFILFPILVLGLVLILILGHILILVLGLVLILILSLVLILVLGLVLILVLQWDMCYGMALNPYLIFYILSLFGLVDIIIRFKGRHMLDTW